MKNLLFAFICSLVFSLISGFLILPLLKRLKAGQTVLGYVKEHKNKNGTPTMGGLFFLIPSTLVFFFFGSGKIATLSIAIGLAFLIVGFVDDFIKIKFRQNEGLKPYQKIAFQLAIALIAGFFAYRNGLTVFHLPFTYKNIDLGLITIPLVVLIFIATTNCVNLTDGLDGLAGSVSCVYLLIICTLIGLQTDKLSHLYLRVSEYQGLQVLSVSLIGGILAFLFFNVNRAKVFMGDTGSLSLGGFIASITIFSSNSFFIPIIGIMFVLSGISVIVQVAYYKRTKKRVFLMAPLHHHFQLKGYTESQIAYAYSLLTAFFGVLCLLIYA